MQKALILFILAFTTNLAISQTTDKVSELVSAENYFSAMVKKKGIKKAFLSVSDDNTIIFRPGPVSVKNYFKDKSDSGSLNWQPIFARIAKSGDWGFTTGPYTYKETDSSTVTHYGEYLSVWKKNTKGVWKLALDAGTPHPKPKRDADLVFQNPRNEIYQKQRSENRLQQREDLIFSSDKLMGTILKADNTIAFKEFVAEGSRLLFPGFEPVIGKKAILDFWQKQNLRLTSEPVKADRSYSGELAFTYGDATIVKKSESKKYNYIRIWEVQPGYVWNVIMEVYTEANEPENN